MLLVVDIGNTNIVFGVYADATLEHTLRVSTVATRTADEVTVLLQELAEVRGIRFADIRGAILSCVVPQATESMTEALRSLLPVEPLVVGPGLKTGMPILYDSPRDVGADRIVNAVAAFDRIKGAVIVVDFGTATTFDCISQRGEYLGGVIAPGLLVSLDGLLERAAKLVRVEVAEPPRVLGRNTTHALQSGMIHGHASLVDGVVHRLNAELETPSAVLATGGLATLIAKHSTTIQAVDPHLTLDGLRLIYGRNQTKAPSSPTASRRVPRGG